MEYIIDGAKRMQALIKDLLVYSRLGQNELTLEPLDLNEIIKEAASNLELVVKETKADIIYGQLPSISGHKPFIVQLFQNLISNSLKYRSSKDPRVRKLHPKKRTISGNLASLTMASALILGMPTVYLCYFSDCMPKEGIRGQE